ncbi:MAG TPA: hypothetical protein VLI40_06850 [Gemmatimonadaceae bacterium]|jgi:hypothetical protein|nr:hypothetical protein [Gemmatimonadaceae bacterium]
MPTSQNDTSSDPRQHTANIKRMLNDTVTHLRDDTEKVDDPRAKALFETSAEVLTGLVTAFEHYDNKSESAWK